MQYFAVIGNPVKHSKSPLIHQLFAEQTGIKLSYTTLEVETQDFVAAVLNFSGSGLNVTKPFKQDAYHLVDKLSPRAKQAQAVNTIKYYPDGSRYGDNTDGVGLIKDLMVNKQLTIKDKQILILGAGGAARGIIAPLLNECPARIVIANRTYDKAVELVSEFGESLKAHPLTGLEKYPADIIINAANLISVPALKLNPDGCCYDLSYGQNASPFLKWASEHGFKNYDGLGMLVEQAAEAFFVWHGIYPKTQSVLPLVIPAQAGIHS